MRDRDTKFTTVFDAVFAAADIVVLEASSVSGKQLMPLERAFQPFGGQPTVGNENPQISENPMAAPSKVVRGAREMRARALIHLIEPRLDGRRAWAANHHARAAPCARPSNHVYRVADDVYSSAASRRTA